MLQNQRTGFSKAGDKSLHCKRLAVDFNFFIGDDYIEDIKTLKVLGEYWESLHPFNSWGGNGITISDSPHFSMGLDKAEFRRVTNVSQQ
jgi:D-alanyl-D-alanine carboxypeptidase